MSHNLFFFSSNKFDAILDILFAYFQHVPNLEEIEKQFMTEFDYRKESEQQIKVRDNLIKSGLAGNSSTLCAVPRVYPDLCTKRVLVMDELKGEKLAVGLKKDMERHAERAGKTPEQFKAEEEKKAKALKEKGLKKKGPSAEEYDRYIKVLDSQRRLSNLRAMMYNFFLGWIPGTSYCSTLKKDILPINHAKMIDDLIYIHGHEVRLHCTPKQSFDDFSYFSCHKKRT